MFTLAMLKEIIDETPDRQILTEDEIIVIKYNPFKRVVVFGDFQEVNPSQMWFPVSIKDFYEFIKLAEPNTEVLCHGNECNVFFDLDHIILTDQKTMEGPYVKFDNKILLKKFYDKLKTFPHFKIKNTECTENIFLYAKDKTELEDIQKYLMYMYNGQASVECDISLFPCWLTIVATPTLKTASYKLMTASNYVTSMKEYISAISTKLCTEINL